jgi:hypothetical protein
MAQPTLLRHTLTAAVAFFALCGAGAQAQTYMNMTVGGQFAPGVFGQVSIGSAPPPPVINLQPIVVGRPIAGAPVVYMHVPEPEQRDWRHACKRYGACGRPVHFVRVEDSNRWWEPHDAPQYERRDDRRDERRDDRRGRNEGRDDREYRHDNGRHQGRDWREDR